MKEPKSQENEAERSKDLEAAHKKVMDNRLATIEGHIKAVRKMVAEDYRCEQILSQVAAVLRALKIAGIEMLKSHMSDYLEGNLKGKAGQAAAHEFNLLLQSFLWLD